MSDVTLRAGLIRLAHSRPDLRPHLLPLVTDRVAMEFDSQDALDRYLKDHPKADKSRHKVKGEGVEESPEEGEVSPATKNELLIENHTPIATGKGLVFDSEI
jgi:hypothetical protein